MKTVSVEVADLYFGHQEPSSVVFRLSISTHLDESLKVYEPIEPDFFKKVFILKGTKVSFSYVQCFLYLVSSSVNISIFLLDD